MVLASLVFLMKKAQERQLQNDDLPVSGLCFGGDNCVCIGGRVGDMCLLTFVVLIVCLVALCAVAFCACTGACCFAQCIKKPQQVTYVGAYPLQAGTPVNLADVEKAN